MKSVYREISEVVCRLFFIVPHYDEDEATVSKIVQSFNDLASCLPKTELVVFYIDDGSKNPLMIPLGVAKEVINCSITIIRLPENLGPGNAFRVGFSEIPANVGEGDFVILIEGDNTSNLDDILSMLWIVSNPFSKIDVVLASPYSFGGRFEGVKLHRLLISRLANFIVRKTLYLDGLHTLGNFFRVFRGPAIKQLKDHFGPGILKSNGFESMVELIWYVSQLHLRVIEFPTTVNHEIRSGKSKMRVLRTSFAYLKLIRKLRSNFE